MGKSDDDATALLALDWGTTALRGARLDPQGRVLEERAFSKGILNVPAGGFPAAFDECFGDWARGGARACLISGMAGSKQGWVEAPYCACPAGFADVAAQLRWITDPTLQLPTAIVPGLNCEHACGLPQLASVPDVMRGEEVQIFGAMHLDGVDEGLFILPGTHSKWAWVRDGRVRNFRSFMTGEVFALLSQHSLLARTIDSTAAFDAQAFALGVARARQGGGLLHNAFGTRTLALMARLDAGPLASYLSGLVIGEELHHHTLTDVRQVMLIGSENLTRRYALAFETLDVKTRSLGAEATWAGLHALGRHLPAERSTR
ncbi:MAG: 2-dehydro-3-deoxygalactonokinase [Betaproteobacteria bacterium]